MSNPINSITYDPYELMIIFPNKKAEMIIKEIQKFEPNLNLVNDLITLGANLDWRDEEERQHWSALHWATNINNLEITKMLVGAGADVNASNEGGCTPLHYTTLYNSIKSSKLLIKSGAKLDIKDENGKLPYDLARSEELKTILRIV